MKTSIGNSEKNCSFVFLGETKEEKINLILLLNELSIPYKYVSIAKLV